MSLFDVRILSGAPRRHPGTTGGQVETSVGPVPRRQNGERVTRKLLVPGLTS